MDRVDGKRGIAYRFFVCGKAYWYFFGGSVRRGKAQVRLVTDHYIAEKEKVDSRFTYTQELYNNTIDYMVQRGMLVMLVVDKHYGGIDVIEKDGRNYIERSDVLYSYNGNSFDKIEIK